MGRRKGRILLVEDETNFGSVLKNYLELSGYEVDWAQDGNVGYSSFKRNANYEICLLDVMMPYKDGLSLARDIRKINEQVPIIFLTAKGEKEDQIEGYKTGADDYLTKPFDTEILLYKIQSLLKRAGNGKEEIPDQLNIGAYVFKPQLRSLTFDDQMERLSPKESQLLLLLSQHMNRITPRSLALRQIWGQDDYFSKRSMDVYIAKLRKRLASDPNIDIENIHSEGYILKVKQA